MALVPDQKFSTFQNGGDLIIGDIIVGLRDGLNTRFNYTGELPAGVVVPVDQGGTGATTASQARINLGLGTIAVQDASAVNITGGNADLTTGTIATSPISGLDIVNKDYVDGLIIPGVTSVTGTANRITSTGGFTPVIDIASTYVGQTSITTLGTIATGTWQGTLIGITYGGTGVSSVTTTPTASSFAGWDTHKNLSASNLINGFTTTATAAGVTVLTVSSTYIQEFTGATTQTVVMPVAATIVAGQSYYIINNSSGNITLQSSGANTILVMAGNTSAIVTCVLNSGTTAASWNATYIVDAGGGVSPGTINQLAWYSATGNTVSGLATANSGVLVTSAGGVPSISTTLPAGLTIPGYTGGFRSTVVQTFSASGTYTPTANMVYAIIEAVGGGGGGGGAATPPATTSRSGAAGGSGSYSRAYVTAATVGASQTVTIGAGGTAGSTAGGNGGAGGSTSVGAICIANGGGGGTGTATLGAGGAGGTAGTGDVTIVGNAGGGTHVTVTNSASANPSVGAPSYFGGGASAIATSGAGLNGTTGGGASGGYSINPAGAAAGGVGGAGYVVITEFIS